MRGHGLRGAENLGRFSSGRLPGPEKMKQNISIMPKFSEKFKQVTKRSLLYKQKMETTISKQSHKETLKYFNSVESNY